MITKAKRRAKIRAELRPQAIEAAIQLLKGARQNLRVCGCRNAADYVARALKSTEGALRHAERVARHGL